MSLQQSEHLWKLKSSGRSARCLRSSTATTQHEFHYLTHATLDPLLVLNFGTVRVS